MNNHQNLDKGATRRIFVIRVENEPGVLARIVGLFSGRGWNIDSLTVHVEGEQIAAKITVVFSATEELAIHIMSKIETIIPVRRVIDLSSDPERVEVMTVLVRLVSADSVARNKAIVEANQHGGRLQAQTDRTLIFSKTGSELACNEFVKVIRAFGTINTNGSGVVVIG